MCKRPPAVSQTAPGELGLLAVLLAFAVENCTLMPSGTACRKVENECDLPEWCNGTSYQCPEDVYMQDGTSCTGGGYCYEKRCNECNEQCRKIFGKEARNANENCYREVTVEALVTVVSQPGRIYHVESQIFCVGGFSVRM